MSDRPLVSFVTVSYRMRHLVRHLLRALQEAKPSFSFEFFLVDNASGDGTVGFVREKHPWVHIIESQTNLGLSRANNLAIAKAQGEYVMILNPDLAIFPGELERWVEWMQTHPDVGISGPRLVNPDATDQDSCYRFPHLLIPAMRRTFLGSTSWGRRSVTNYLMKDMDRSVEQDVDWILGAAMLIRREVLEKIGRFDERYFLYFEDTDVCRRAWQSGSRVCYTPAAKIIHLHQRDSRTSHAWEIFKNPVTRIHLHSALKYYWKYRGEKNPRSETPPAPLIRGGHLDRSP